jgi:GT2 family glycosyltransferase
MDASILTVTWNSEKYIQKQIESVKSGAADLEIEQLIADNNSSDGTVSIIKNQFPNLYLKEISYNSGFAFANNYLFEKSTGEYIILINPDIEVLPGAIKKIVNFAKDHPKAGVVGGLLMDENGLVKKDATPRRFPKLIDQLVILFKLHHLFPGLLGNYLRADFDPTKEQQVDSIQGAFMLINRELCRKLGYLLDERYYIWFEDVDLCREAKKNDYEVWFCPVPVAKDFGGRSFIKQPILWRQINFFKSMFKYFHKWGLD